MDAVLESALKAHLVEIRAWLSMRCRDADLADELTQEVAARAATRHLALDPGQNPGGYLVRMAQNVWRDWLRRELVRRRAAVTIGAEAAPAPAADQEALARELQQGLGRAIDALPRAEREVVVLRHQGDLTFQQIADRLGLPLGTVLSQMRTALQRMQDTMEAYR